jgi:hypothetical protein
MKLKYKFIIRSVAGNSVALAVGDDNQKFNGMIKLNETGRIIWDMLSKGKEQEEIVAKILEEYDIDRATVEADVSRFISTLMEDGILEA